MPSIRFSQIQFGALVVVKDGGIEATHIPMVVRRDGSEIHLDGHVARTNPLAKMLDSSVAALAIFQGPHGYVSPGWLETKRQTGKGVPTWNYVVVHAHGQLKVVHDEDWLLHHLAQLTDRNEAGRAEPWSLADGPDGFIDQLLCGIVGITIRIAKLEGIRKLSANHPQMN